MFTGLFSLIIWIIAVIIAITIHEFSHALAADRLGDPTARISDRLTLNPIKHYDPVGTTILFVTAILRALGAPVIPIGWAKPVPFDPYNLKNSKRDSALIALAGPVSNILLAIVFSIILRFVLIENALISTIATSMIMLNVALAVFNLVPIHPLDGGKILVGILPTDLAIEYESIMRRYGIFFLFAFIFYASSIISGPINFLLNLLLPFRF